MSVRLVRADVADRAGLTAALDAVRQEAGPIATVVHTAGVLDDATVANLTDERVLRVLAPKVLGTALLTELVPEAENLVLFASVAGLLGSAGQSPYSAANAFLDAWAHHLSRTGRRALSLDWGAWAEVGMVAASGTRAAETGRSGLIAFTPQEGGELFDRVLATSRRQLAPVALDWELLALDPDAARTRPVLADLVTAPVTGTHADDLVRKILTAPTDQDRAEHLEAYVRARVAEVSGGTAEPSPTAGLKELGLDSLMLVRLRNAFARELGVELPAAAMFSAPDLRGLARTLGRALPESAPATKTPVRQPAERAVEVPETALRPATRDVVRLLRSAQPGMPDPAHAVGLAVRLTSTTTRETLTAILTRLAARHAALRTGIVTGPEGGRQLLVRRESAEPLLRWTPVTAATGPDADEGLRLLLEPPFDLTRPPLWRFELLDGGARGQILVYGAHHAVSDLQSLLLVAAEIDAELSGTPLGDTVTNRDIDLLIEAQETKGARQTREPGDGAAEWRQAFHGSSRLDLTLARPRPARRSYRAGSVTVPLPDGLPERVSAAASRLAVTPAAFCLGALTVLLARRRERERFVLAVPVDTRIHADAFDAVGFFGVPVPFPAEARPDEPIEEVLRRTDSRLGKVLAKGAVFSDVLPTLAKQGLYRPNAPLVEVYFNYVRSASGRLTHLDVLPAGTGYSDLDLMITMTPDAGRVRLDHNLDILDEATATGLGEELVRLLGETAEDPAARYGPRGRRWGRCRARWGRPWARSGLCRARPGGPWALRPQRRARWRQRPRSTQCLPRPATPSAPPPPSLAARSPSPPPSLSATSPRCARRRSTREFGTAGRPRSRKPRTTRCWPPCRTPPALSPTPPRRPVWCWSGQRTWSASGRWTTHCSPSCATRIRPRYGPWPTAPASRSSSASCLPHTPRSASRAGNGRSPTNSPNCPASRCCGPMTGRATTPSGNGSTSGPNAWPTSPSPRTSRRRWPCAWPRPYGRSGVPRRR